MINKLQVRPTRYHIEMTVIFHIENILLILLILVPCLSLSVYCIVFT